MWWQIPCKGKYIIETDSKQVPWGRYENDFEKRIKRAWNCWAESKQTCAEWWDCCIPSCRLCVEVCAMVLALNTSFATWNHYSCAWMKICFRAMQCMHMIWYWVALWHMAWLGALGLGRVPFLGVCHDLVLCCWKLVLLDPSWNTDQGV